MAPCSAGILFGRLFEGVEDSVELALQCGDFVRGEGYALVGEVAAHLLGDLAGLFFEGLALLGQDGDDDALVFGAADSSFLSTGVRVPESR